MAQFLLVTDIGGVDTLINAASIITITPNSENKEYSEVLLPNGLIDVQADFWTLYHALRSAEPVVDCQMEQVESPT